MLMPCHYAIYYCHFSLIISIDLRFPDYADAFFAIIFAASHCRLFRHYFANIISIDAIDYADVIDITIVLHDTLSLPLYLILLIIVYFGVY